MGSQSSSGSSSNSNSKDNGYQFTVIVLKNGKKIVHESNRAADICIECLQAYDFKQGIIKVTKYEEKALLISHRVLVAETSKSYLLCEFFNNSACRIVIADFFDKRLVDRYELELSKYCSSSKAQDFLIKALAYGMNEYSLKNYNCDNYCQDVYAYLK